MSKDSVLGLFRQHADTHPERPPSSIASARSATANSTDSATGWPPTWPGAASPGASGCLLAERSAELVIAILAAAKRSGLRTGGPSATRQAQAGNPPPVPGPVALATQAEDLPGQPVEVIAQVLATSAAGAAPRPALDGSEALYVIFTSAPPANPRAW